MRSIAVIGNHRTDTTNIQAAISLHELNLGLDVVPYGKLAAYLDASPKPEIVVFDPMQSGKQPFEAFTLVRRLSPRSRIILWSGVPHAQNYLIDFFAAGASGFLPRETSVVEWKRAIDTVMRGDVYLCHDIRANLIQQIKKAPGRQ